MKLGVAILAAGPGLRAGGCKLARMICGKPLLEWSLRPAAILRGDVVRVLVVGACLCAIEKVDTELLSMYRVVYNPWWREGMASSARIAATVLEDASVDIAVFTLGDMPLVTPDLLERLASLVKEGWEAAYTSHGGLRGPPAAFRREVLGLIKRLRGDRGPGVLWGSVKATLVEPLNRLEVVDVDRPGDFRVVEEVLCRRL